MATSQTWRCPFCEHRATITQENRSSGYGDFDDNNKYGKQCVSWVSLSCPNPDCREYTLSLTVWNHGLRANKTYGATSVRHQFALIPQANVRVMPSYVPAPIVEDYREACLIETLSPKASATLSRRCLQGMIRDFWVVQKARLVDEIDGIKDKVDDEAWAAIDGVRKIGNIGAHMERDINVIVEVEPNEARLLIQLIEMLIDEWYVARHQRQERLSAVTAAAQQKAQAKLSPPPAEADPSTP